MGVSGFDTATWKTLNYPSLLPAYLAQPLRVPIYLVSGDHDDYGIAFETALAFKQIYARQPALAELRVVGWRPFLGRVVERDRRCDEIHVPLRSKLGHRQRWHHALSRWQNRKCAAVMRLQITADDSSKGQSGEHRDEDGDDGKSDDQLGQTPVLGVETRKR